MPTQMEPDVAGSPKTEEGKTVDHQEVSNWRKLEETVKTMGVNKPAEMTVIMHDGTGSGGLPRFRSGGVWNKNNEVSSPTTPTWLPLVGSTRWSCSSGPLATPTPAWMRYTSSTTWSRVTRPAGRQQLIKWKGQTCFTSVA